MTPKTRWGTPPGLVFGANMGAFGTILARILEHFWTSIETYFVHFFHDFRDAFGLIRASAVAGSPLCGALDINKYVYI